MSDKKLIRVCPRCGSADLYSKNWGKVSAPVPTCRNCEFTGQVFEVTKESQKEIQEKYAKGESRVKSSIGIANASLISIHSPWPRLTKIGLIVLAIAFALMILGMLGIIDLSKPI